MLWFPISTVGELGLTTKVSEFDVVPPGVPTLTAALPLPAIAFAGTDAVSCVELPKLLVRATPFHNTTSPEAKLLPLTVSVKPGPPAIALAGETEFSAGTGVVVRKLKAFEVAPLGVLTLMDSVPGLAMDAAGTDAVSCVVAAKTVVSGEPFQSIVSPEIKLFPLTVNVKLADPATALDGESELRVGTAAAMLKVRELDVPELGVCTLTDALPEFAMKLLGTVAVSCVALANVVASEAPFHDTVSPETKLVPLTDKVNAAPPASVFDGDKEFKVGAGGLTVKPRGLDTAPAAVCALTDTLPGLTIQLAGTIAASCAELLNVVTSDVPFHNTVSPETKLAPLTVSVNCAPPARALDGDNMLREGTGGLIAKLKELDVPPAAVCTATDAVPILAIKPAGTAALSCVELPKLVARALPFHSTVFPETKLLPLTVKVNALPPAFLLEGERELRVGSGSGAGADTVSVVVTTVGDPAEPGELTVTCPI